jgi:dihydroorotase
MATMLLKGGRIFLHGEFLEKDILIDAEKILSIANSITADVKPFDASGLVIIPGLIDPHVHLREPGAEYKEDFFTGTKAAIAGGFTTVIDMPNNQIATTTRERLEQKQTLAGKKAKCDVFFHFGTTDDNFTEVKKADPLSLKVYMGKSTGELMLRKKESLQRHFSNFPKTRPIVLHTSGDSEEESRSIAYSCQNIKQAIDIADGRCLHLAHASTKAEVELAKTYAGFTFEIAPHHLFLSQKDKEKLGYLGTVYPPLRSEEQRKMLWEVLPFADCIASDHAPHTVEDKEGGARGFAGLETALSLMLDAYTKKLVKLEWIVQRMSEQPARIFGLKDAGNVKEGAVANLTIVNLKKEWKVKGEELFTKCKWSPFDGKTLKGKVQSVIFRGEQIFEEGEFATK